MTSRQIPAYQQAGFSIMSLLDHLTQLLQLFNFNKLLIVLIIFWSSLLSFYTFHVQKDISENVKLHTVRIPVIKCSENNTNETVRSVVQK